MDDDTQEVDWWCEYDYWWVDVIFFVAAVSLLEYLLPLSAIEDFLVIALGATC